MPKPHSKKPFSSVSRAGAGRRWRLCREVLACDKSTCRAFDGSDIPCWRIPGTLCDNHRHAGGAAKFRDCLVCPVLKLCAEADECGWNHFIYREFSLLLEADPTGEALKRLEENLRLSEDNYRRLFEGSQDMIFFTDRTGAFRDVNRACVDLLGYDDKNELLSLASIEQVCDKSTHWRVFKRQIDRNGFVKDFEARFRRKDGSRLHCLLSGQAVFGNAGEFAGYQGIAKDITARMDAVQSFRQRHRELWVLNTVAFAMNRSQDLDSILMTALKKVLEVLNLSAGGIYLIDHGKPGFVLRVEKGFPEAAPEETPSIELEDAVLMNALLQKDLKLTPEPIFPPFHAAIRDGRAAVRMHLTCFLITAKDKASGFMALDVPPDRDITVGHDYHLLGSMGNFLGGAIENKQLMQTVQRHREELKGLTARLFHSQENERRRIARELHDEAGQALTGINFTLETIEKHLSGSPDPIPGLIADVKKQINRTYHEMRRLSHRLHPALLTDLGLEPALDAYLSSVSEHRPLATEFKMVGFEERLSPEIESVLYRLSQEALTNTLKHAEASRFKLSIIKSYPHIIFLAEDDGKGFSPRVHNGSNEALGLLSMRERAAMLGGSFSLRTAKGGGTRIRIEIPVREKEDD